MIRSTVSLQSALILCLLIPTAVFSPIWNLPQDSVIIVGVLGFLPLVFCLSYQWFYPLAWKWLAAALGLEFFVATPLYLLTITQVPAISSIYAFLNSYHGGHSIAHLLAMFVSTFLEELTKLLPLLILYRPLARTSNEIAGTGIGFFCGLAFGYVETICTALWGYDWSGDADLSNVIYLVISRSLFFPIFHAGLTGVAASFVMPSVRANSLFLRLSAGLALASSLHLANNGASGVWRLSIVFLIVGILAVRLSILKRCAQQFVTQPILPPSTNEPRNA